MRLWLAWAWSRLTRQHRIPWWRVDLEVESAKRRATAERLVREYLTTRGEV